MARGKAHEIAARIARSADHADFDFRHIRLPPFANRALADLDEPEKRFHRPSKCGNLGGSELVGVQGKGARGP
jgi:hypothetical protein